MYIFHCWYVMLGLVWNMKIFCSEDLFWFQSYWSRNIFHINFRLLFGISMVIIQTLFTNFVSHMLNGLFINCDYCTKSGDKLNPFSWYWSWCTCWFAVQKSCSLWNVLSDMSFMQIRCFQSMLFWWEHPDSERGDSYSPFDTTLALPWAGARGTPVTHRL